MYELNLFSLYQLHLFTFNIMQLYTTVTISHLSELKSLKLILSNVSDSVLFLTFWSVVKIMSLKIEIRNYDCSTDSVVVKIFKIHQLLPTINRTLLHQLKTYSSI